MTEVSNDPRPDTEARRVTVEHGNTITSDEQTSPMGDSELDPDSGLVASNPIALAEGEAHIIREATSDALQVRERIEAKRVSPIGDTTAESPQSMRYPATDAHGRVFDLFLPLRGPDPFIDECPAWCELATSGHSSESCDEDRNHWGQIYRVPVRSMPAEYEPGDDVGAPAGHVMGAAMIYLRRGGLQRDPQILLAKGDVGEKESLLLSLSEAEDIATLLTTLVRTAEAGR